MPGSGAPRKYRACNSLGPNNLDANGIRNSGIYTVKHKPGLLPQSYIADPDCCEESPEIPGAGPRPAVSPTTSQNVLLYNKFAP